MLTVSVIKNARHAEYYEKDDYYFSKGAGEGGSDFDEMGSTSLTWWGKGAERLGLTGEAAKADFRLVMSGVNPDPNGPALSKAQRSGMADPDGKPSPSESMWWREQGGVDALTKAQKESAREYFEVWAGENPDAARKHGFEGYVTYVQGQEAERQKRGEPSQFPEMTGGGEHRPGLDLTFSAPKSVSIAILVAGDKRLLEAHNAAVDKALTWAEEKYAITRVRDGSEHGRDMVRTGELLVARTVHCTSRAGDPNLHTHAVVANATWLNEKGQMRALENSEFFENQKLMGLVYRTELARSAMALGYDIRPHKDGMWELAAFPRRLLDHFSKSADRVKENLDREQPETAAAKALVKTLNRPSKDELAHDAALAKWEAECQQLGMDPKSMLPLYDAKRDLPLLGPGRRLETPFGGFKHQLMVKKAELEDRIHEWLQGGRKDPYGYGKGEAPSEAALEARQAVSYGLQVSETGKAVFKAGEPLKLALQEAPGADINALDRELSALAAQGKVRHADKVVVDGLTTARSVAIENKVVEIIKDGLGQSRPIMHLQHALERVSDQGMLAAGHSKALTDGQKAAAVLALSSTDRVVAIQGSAGVGKSTLFEAAAAATREVSGDQKDQTEWSGMFQVVAQAALDRGVGMVGLTPTHTAREELTVKTGMSAYSVAHYLARHDHLAKDWARASDEQKADWKGKTLIVDESSMISNVDALRLLRISKALEVEKVVFVGDYRQLGSIEAGAIFKYAQENGAPLAEIKEIVRQRASPEFLKTVELLAEGKSWAPTQGAGITFRELGDQAGDVSLCNAAFGLWSEGRDAGVTRPIITATQAQRTMVNDLILDEMKARGEIWAIGPDRDRLVPVFLSGPEQYRARHYEVGNTLIFHAGLRGGIGSAAIARNAHVEIVGRDLAANMLVVKDQNGQTAHLDLKAFGRNGRTPFTAWQSEKGGQLHVGADMVWERSDKDRGFYAGETFTPVGERDGEVLVRTAKGDVVAMSWNDPQLALVGPGYAMTTHRAQSATMEVNPIGVIQARQASHAMVYVQVSRAVHGIDLVTDSRDRLVGQMSAKDGINLIANENLRDGARSVERTQETNERRAEPGMSENPDKELKLERGRERTLPRWSR